MINTNEIVGTFDNDNLTGSDRKETIEGGLGDDTLQGLGRNDLLYGSFGNDVLDGGLGKDTLSGEFDNDTYMIDSQGDVIEEPDSEDVDTVKSSIDYQLGDNLENLILLDNALNGKGNSLNNQITGNALDNNLDGESGNDTLYGGEGNDSLLGWMGDDYIYAGLGNDTLNGEVGDDLLSGSLGNDSLDGWTGDDNLFGGAGNDSLTGSSGEDYLNGYGYTENEQDILTGGDDADVFVLGNQSMAYYQDNGTATIKDFNAAEGDKIMVYGSFDDYSAVEVNGVVSLSYQSNLISYLENANANDVISTLIAVENYI